MNRALPYAVDDALSGRILWLTHKKNGSSEPFFCFDFLCLA